MLEIKDLSVHAGDFSLKDLSFIVESGDYFILLGKSGAGKSILLETIAGLIRPASGSVKLNGVEISGQKIQNRGIGLVFQDYAIFPHLTVRENIAYSLHGTPYSTEEKKEMILAIAEKVGISGLLGRKPSTLSGGELQRAALARTLIQKPAVLLLDEPLSSLDAQLRTDLRSLLRSLNRSGQTIIHVSHDYEEAISLGNRIAVIHNGMILQCGSPAEVFHHPRSEFVAHFTGAKNFFRAVIVQEGDAYYGVVNKTVRIRLGIVPGKEGFLLIRSEDILLSNSRSETSATNNFEGHVREIIPSRHGAEVLVDIGIPLYAMITQDSLVNLDISEGKKILVSFKASAVRFID